MSIFIPMKCKECLAYKNRQCLPYGDIETRTSTGECYYSANIQKVIYAVKQFIRSF